MDDEHGSTIFMALVAHELKGSFARIHAATERALLRPEELYLKHIQNAREAGFDILQNIQLLARRR